MEMEVIARNRQIHVIARLRKWYGGKNWRKMKGVTQVRLVNGHVRWAEVHWYEAHGVSKKHIKIKKFLD
jgi:hypothetical protein